MEHEVKVSPKEKCEVDNVSSAHQVQVSERRPHNLIRLLAGMSAIKARFISRSVVKIEVAQNAEMLALYNDARLREIGMLFGASLSFLTILGGIGLAFTGGAFAPILLCFAVGVACAGGTLAIATGQKVTTKDFSNMVNSVGNLSKPQSEGNDDEH